MTGVQTVLFRSIIVILLVVAVSGSFIGAHLSTFTEMVYSRIEHGF